MKILPAILITVLSIGLSLSIPQAEAAKRLGGGKTTGMQRQMTPPAAAPAAAPAQAKPATPAAAPQAQPGRSWMGPLAGLAAGLGLAALASHFGFGQELANMMMIALLVMVVMVVIGFIMRKRAAAQSGGLQYSAAGAQPGAPGRAFDAMMPPPSGTLASQPVTESAVANIPADFDVPAFVRNAKVQFIRLQAANDARNLDDLREFTTPEMFAELKMNIDERGNASQETNVLNINADVIEVAEEANRYVVSVRFTGQISEDGATPEAVDEIWHLTKPRDGKTGWLLAGIQQV